MYLTQCPRVATNVPAGWCHEQQAKRATNTGSGIVDAGIVVAQEADTQVVVVIERVRANRTPTSTLEDVRLLRVGVTTNRERVPEAEPTVVVPVVRVDLPDPLHQVGSTQLLTGRVVLPADSL
jgi:hypothetical protein